MNDFVDELKQNNFGKALDTLYEQDTGTRNTPKASVKRKAIKAVFSTIKEKQEVLHIALKLAHIDDPAAKEIAAHLLAFAYAERPEKVSEALRVLANDENWEVREWVAGGCGEILSNNFDTFYPEMMDWTADESDNVRRAAALAAMYAGKTRKEEYGEPLLNLVEQLLTDSASYVKKNLGQFAIGDGLLRYYPDKVIARLDKWIELEDENARWNLAKIFSTAEGMKHVRESRLIIHELLRDDRYKVKRAIQSTLNKIKKKHPELLEELDLENAGN
ncbi:HEAT repeat domain-containing protein [Virgibacillus kekensis]|uniref:HEAT repeat domain-containing protein n=1 Tax=Virgibacillus kekensis TaxID=202261 RepID=A0ABV9DPK9_9BACI